MCNACGLYYRLHRVIFKVVNKKFFKTNRPAHMRKDFIQQRFRRKNMIRDEDVSSVDSFHNSGVVLSNESQLNGSSNFNNSAIQSLLAELVESQQQKSGY